MGLDDFFGPKEKKDVGPRDLAGAVARGMAGGTRWRCEARLHEALDTYIEVRGEDAIPRSNERRQSLYSAMRTLVEEIGEADAPEFIYYANTAMQRRNLDVSSPRSYLWLVDRFRAYKRSSVTYEPEEIEPPPRFVCERCGGYTLNEVALSLPCREHMKEDG